MWNFKIYRVSLTFNVQYVISVRHYGVRLVEDLLHWRSKPWIIHWNIIKFVQRNDVPTSCWVSYSSGKCKFVLQLLPAVRNALEKGKFFCSFLSPNFNGLSYLQFSRGEYSRLIFFLKHLGGLETQILESGWLITHLWPVHRFFQYEPRSGIFCALFAAKKITYWSWSARMGKNCVLGFEWSRRTSALVRTQELGHSVSPY